MLPIALVIQERDRVATASEGVTRLAILRKDVLEKEQAIESVVLSKRSRLLHLLGVNGKPKDEQWWWPTV